MPQWVPRVVLSSVMLAAHVATAAAQTGPASDYRALLDRYCASCHNQRLHTANLNLDKAGVDLGAVANHASVLEKVLQKLQAGSMPPAGLPRPSPDTYRQFAGWLESELDRAAAARPNPGRPTAHRLNRAEYTNAVRDLLTLDIDAPSLLPTDDLSFGFDNNADLLGLSPGLLERYLSAAQHIARVAVGDPALRPVIDTYKVSPLLVQDDRMSEDLPFGTRGGAAIQHYFPLDGDYTIRLRLVRDNIYVIRGLAEPDQIDVRVDGALVRQFTVGGPDAIKSKTEADADLEVRLPIKAGRHHVSATFPKSTAVMGGVLPERLPVGNFLLSGTARATGLREQIGIATVQIGGPYNGTTPTDTPSRRAIFTCRPGDKDEKCAAAILSRLAHRAFRRPIRSEDVDALMTFYRDGRRNGTFDRGIQQALARILVDPEFLFRVEQDAPKAAAGAAYRITDLELASRLSFFLWSSIPDEELLAAAEKGKLKDRAVLVAQVRRMLADERSSTLVSNFSAQWLQLRKIRAVTPDVNQFPEFDDNLRLAMQRETELFIDSQIREDRGIGELLTANYTFLNERLARHYGVDGVYGSQFRRVTYADDRRAGLLGQGSILTVTSHATRTSPVLRGKWVLDNLLGAPPPPPPADVPALPEKGEGNEPASVRARLEQHRNNPVCASCHSRMDPLGFALENFDGIGKWRVRDQDGAAIDAAAALPEGIAFEGPSALRTLLDSRREQFAATVAAKLLTYALGRGVEYYDKPALRAVVRSAAASDYRWSSVILGIVESVPFQMRRAEP